MVSSDSETMSELQELVMRSAALRREFAQSSARVDEVGEEPAENLRRIWEAGLKRMNVPRKYGGLSNGMMGSGFEALTESIINIAAGEGSTGQIYFVQALVARELFHPQVQLPEATRQQLAHEILQEDVRFVSANAEAGVSRRVRARRVDGGIVLNGKKTFNTSSGSARYAAVGHLLDDREGMHVALVRLDDPAVKQHHDWDNMGQRATESQTITYEDVFVQDGWYFHIPDSLMSLFGPVAFTMHGALLLGIGSGGFDAMLDYLRKNQRTIYPGARSSDEDPLVRLRVGDLSSALAAAHALQREAARQTEAFAEGTDITELLIHTSRARIVSSEVALKVTGELFELTGARSTANTYRLDRFWRDARTFSVAVPTDLRRLAVGMYELNGQAASMNFSQAVQGRI